MNVHIERVPPDPDDPRAAALAETLRAERPGEHAQHRADDIVVTRFDVNADDEPLGTTSVRVPHITGSARVTPTGRRHVDDPGTTTTHEHEEDDQ
ncbi:hypothetical protein [Pseudonocardia sp. MH-G8]|uniref:hypothetical protein n=1 Tax=Pseudonocardia sp. MH-G8 TaxID=1854588 RepID=UPI000B9FC090|nr:hypothetical protein [Pseudonocardia sp. MH-G8]OZM81149.1 hypothetical protein CFP66_17365 [Pseudonocardia sp. MH-G8]